MSRGVTVRERELRSSRYVSRRRQQALLVCSNGQGEGHAADIRSDIYSLGCTLYYVLAGQPPFPGSNLVRKMVHHATEPAPPLRKFNPAVPDGLQQIVTWMMAKDPTQRYPTPRRAAQALQAYIGAGAERTPRKLPAKMRAYLEWLDSTRGERTPAARVPVATPVALAPPVPAAPGDGELVAVAPTNKRTPSLGSLSRRDALMLWIGAGFLAAAGGAALVLKRVLGKKKAQAEQKEPKDD